MCRSEEKCQELTLQIRNAPREEEVERFAAMTVVIVVITQRDLYQLHYELKVNYRLRQLLCLNVKSVQCLFMQRPGAPYKSH